MLNNLLLFFVKNKEAVVNIELVIMDETVGVRVAFLHSFHEPANECHQQVYCLCIQTPKTDIVDKVRQIPDIA